LPPLFFNTFIFIVICPVEMLIKIVEKYFSTKNRIVILLIKKHLLVKIVEK
jgi:hypothetical protein